MWQLGELRGVTWQIKLFRLHQRWGERGGGRQSARRLRSVGFSSLSQFSNACSKMRSAHSPFFLKSRTAPKINAHTAEESWGSARWYLKQGDAHQTSVHSTLCQIIDGGGGWSKKLLAVARQLLKKRSSWWRTAAFSTTGPCFLEWWVKKKQTNWQVAAECDADS